LPSRESGWTLVVPVDLIMAWFSRSPRLPRLAVVTSGNLNRQCLMNYHLFRLFSKRPWTVASEVVIR
jgi:hypothetical protein